MSVSLVLIIIASCVAMAASINPVTAAVPATGDTTGIIVWAAVVVISLCGAVILLIRHRRSH